MWAIIVGLLAVIGAAGQAVRPVLAGAIQGSATLVVEQTVLVSSFSDSSDANDYADAVNDDGTCFTIAIETQAGRKIDDTDITLGNGSGETANAVLRLDWPAELDVEMDEASSSSAEVARISANRWLMTVPAGSSGTTLGTDWTPTRVDGGAGDTNSSQDVGRFNSIAAVDAGTLYVSYFDDTNDDMFVAKSTDGGSTWTPTRVDRGAGYTNVS